MSESHTCVEPHTCAEHSGMCTEVTNLKEAVGALRQDVKLIKDDLLKRPSWATLVVVTLLSSALVGVGVAYLSLLSKVSGLA